MRKRTRESSFNVPSPVDLHPSNALLPLFHHIARHVRDSARPGLIGIAPDIDRFPELDFAGLDVLYFDIDVEGEIASPSAPMR
jgi:hypothetical protein